MSDRIQDTEMKRAEDGDPKGFVGWYDKIKMDLRSKTCNYVELQRNSSPGYR